MDIKFTRTIWADKELAKLCPGNNIARLGEILGSDDFVAQADTIIRVIQIMNEAYERKLHFEDNSHEINVVPTEYLENLSEEELMVLCNMAFAQFSEDGKTTVEAEPEKKEELPVSN